MLFDLTAFGPKVRDYEAQWESLSLDWTVSAVGGYPREPSVWVGFDGAGWLAQVCVWATGETELETIRIADRRVVNKHHDLESVDDLDATFGELIALIRDGATPPGAVVGPSLTAATPAVTCSTFLRRNPSGAPHMS